MDMSLATPSEIIEAIRATGRQDLLFDLGVVINDINPSRKILRELEKSETTTVTLIGYTDRLMAVKGLRNLLGWKLVKSVQYVNNFEPLVLENCSIPFHIFMTYGFAVSRETVDSVLVDEHLLDRYSSPGGPYA